MQNTVLFFIGIILRFFGCEHLFHGGLELLESLDIFLLRVINEFDLLGGGEEVLLDLLRCNHMTGFQQLQRHHEHLHSITIDNINRLLLGVNSQAMTVHTHGF